MEKTAQPTAPPQANAAVEPVLGEATLVEGMLPATTSNHHELILAVAQAEGTTIPEVVAMETATVEAVTTEPVVEAATTTTLALGTTVAPEASAGAQVDPQPEANTQVVIREVMIEDATPLRSAPMLETGSTSSGGLELLDDDLIDPTFVSLSMESWCRTENGIKVCCEYPEVTCLSEY
jgi:hypothetical protein